MRRRLQGLRDPPLVKIGKTPAPANVELAIARSEAVCSSPSSHGTGASNLRMPDEVRQQLQDDSDSVAHSPDASAHTSQTDSGTADNIESHTEGSSMYRRFKWGDVCSSQPLLHQSAASALANAAELRKQTAQLLPSSGAH